LTWGVPFIDRVVAMATSRGLEPLITLWMTPAWANGGAGSRTLPHDVNHYANAARWMAARYAGRVNAWEVWNEPNLDEYMTGASAAAYAGLLRAAYPAIKSGNPAATVVFGGPSMNDDAWIGKAYAAGVKGYFDVMATHPYMAIADQAPETPDNGTRYVLTHVAAVRRLMDSQGDAHKKIWFTEFGWSSHANTGLDLSCGCNNWVRGVSETTQGDYLVRTLKLIKAQFPYVTHAFWYTERNLSQPSSTDWGALQNANYGLLYNDLTPKPAAKMVRAYLASLAPAPTASPTPTPAGSPTPTRTPTPSATPTPAPTPEATLSAEPTPTASPKPTVSPSPTPTPSRTSRRHWRKGAHVLTRIGYALKFVR
jgi:cell division septation protein DedD